MEREIIKSVIIENKQFNDTLFRLRMERKSIDFIPGQHVSLSINSNRAREYSIASGIHDDYIDILIRLIPNGYLSKDLMKLKPNDEIYIGKPIGHFTVGKNIDNSEISLISTGSGVAPFISFTRSFPGKKFNVIHGIKNKEDDLRGEFTENALYVSCTSQDNSGNFNGRISSYLNEDIINKNSKYYLCGNGSMIQDIYRLLIDKDVPRENIMYEEYFNN